MGRRIILHIGSPKCGSTYLQRVLLDNSQALLAGRANYPHDGGGHPGNAADIAKIDKEGFERMFEAADTVVLSHEDLFATAARGKSLARLARENGVKIQLVAFLRPFSEFVFGDYSQFMKQHFDSFLSTRNPYKGRCFEEFALDRSRTLKPGNYFQDWLAVLGLKQITLAGYRQIRQTIEPMLGIEGLNWEVPRDLTNPSLRVEDCERLASVMRDPRWSEDEIRLLYHDAFQRIGLPDAGRAAARKAWVEKLFQRQNDQLKSDFGFDNRDSPAAD